MKKTIKLNERELHRLISESVKRVLMEGKNLELAQAAFNEKEIKDLFEKTREVFEYYFGLNEKYDVEKFFDTSHAVGEEVLFLNLPYIRGYDYGKIEMALQKIGWIKDNDNEWFDEFYYELNNTIDTQENRNKQIEREKNSQFVDDLSTNYIKRQNMNNRNKNQELPFRNNLRQFGVDDLGGENALTDKQLYGNPNFRNLVQFH